VATHREVRVNAGGEPERDDFPLPPVDIEIPDDARALARDVQAYHREQRAARRRRRLGRLHAPLTRDGMVLPLLAGCLVMVMISGVLLTVFSASNSGTPAAAFRASSSISPQTPQFSAAGSSTASPSSPSSSPLSSQLRPLVSATVVTGGRAMAVYQLLPAVLALAPAGCPCTAALRQLRRQTAAHNVPLYLITTPDEQPAAARLARAAGLPASRIVVDRDGQVTAELSPPRLSPPGLTAAFVGRRGVIAANRFDLPGRSRLAARQLAPAFAALTAKS
jgi:hypothetical protein